MMRFVRSALPGLLLLALIVPRLALAQGAMIYGTDTIGTPPTVSLPTSTDAWFTNRHGSGTNGTQVPDYWTNKVGGELDALIGACTSIDMTVRTQALACIQQLIGSKGHEAGFSVGSSTWTAPANVYTVKVRAWGGGSGGGGSAAVMGSAAGGGQGGAQQELYISVVPGTTYPIQVGAGGSGAGGAGTGTGSSGTATTFNSSTVYAGPGVGGTGSASSSSLGLGGAAAGAGGYGGNGAYIAGLSIGQGGYGGGTLFGAPYTPLNFGQGVPGACPGGGGEGGSNGGGGGNGCSGLMLLEW